MHDVYGSQTLNLTVPIHSETVTLQMEFRETPNFRHSGSSTRPIGLLSHLIGNWFDLKIQHGEESPARFMRRRGSANIAQ